MRIFAIVGTPHNGNTRAITDLFLDEFRAGGAEIDELVLPRDFGDTCLGCANCILHGEDKCPHYGQTAPIVERMEKADLIILATPVFVGSCTGALKELLDHFAYMWLVHRPKEVMFGKTGLIITSAGGSGVKQTVKLLRSNMSFWGISSVHSYGVTTMKMNGNYADYKDKDKIKKQVRSAAGKVTKSVERRKVSFGTKFLFGIFKMSQKNGWNKTDSDYWKEKGWLDGMKPF